MENKVDTTKKHNVIYHNADLDGFCSGSIVKKALLRDGVPESNIEMIGWNYGDPSPINRDGVIIMTDISLPENDMISLRSYKDQVIWIDHHKSAIQDSIGKWDWFDGIRRVGDSASLLAWEYFFKGEPIPKLVYYVDRYDVWKQGFDGNVNWRGVLEAQFGMRLWLKDPSDKLEFNRWDNSFSNIVLVNSYITQGNVILNFKEYDNKVVSKRAFDLHFEGLKFCAVCNEGNSETVKSVVRSDHDAIMLFRYDKSKWRISLYANELSWIPIDVSLVAKRYGGGGHAGSAGFEIANINEVLNWAYLDRAVDTG